MGRSRLHWLAILLLLFLSFSGHARDSGELSAEEALPPFLDKPGALFFEGNWVVSWDDVPAGQTSQAVFTLGRGWSYGCPPGVDSCYMHYFRKPGADWKLIGMAGGVKDGAFSWIRAYGVEPAVSEGQLDVDHYYYVLGHWGGRESVPRGSETNTLAGRWTYGDHGGASRWQRAVAQVESVVFKVKDGDNTRRSTARPGDDSLPTVEMTWDGYWWGEKNTMRGNRPAFSVEVLGKQFWGLQYPWIDERSKLEIQRPAHICSDGDWYNEGHWYPCIEDGGLEGAVGLAFTIKIWPGIQPGIKTLYINGTPIRFELVIHGFPHPEPPPPRRVS